MGSIAGLCTYSKFILKYILKTRQNSNVIPRLRTSLYSAALVAVILKCLSIRTYLVWQSNVNCKKSHIHIFFNLVAHTKLCM